MASRRIYVDKTEIVFMVPTKNKVTRQCLCARDIVRIQFHKKDSKFLGLIPTTAESIEVVSGKLANPLVYKKNQNKQFFAEYKRDLEKFAKDNMVTFMDDTAN